MIRADGRAGPAAPARTAPRSGHRARSRSPPRRRPRRPGGLRRPAPESDPGPHTSPCAAARRCSPRSRSRRRRRRRRRSASTSRRSPGSAPRPRPRLPRRRSPLSNQRVIGYAVIGVGAGDGSRRGGRPRDRRAVNRSARTRRTRASTTSARRPASTLSPRADLRQRGAMGGIGGIAGRGRGRDAGRDGALPRARAAHRLGGVDPGWLAPGGGGIGLHGGSARLAAPASLAALVVLLARALALGVQDDLMVAAHVTAHVPRDPGDREATTASPSSRRGSR